MFYCEEMGRPHYSTFICCLPQHDTIHPFCGPVSFTLTMKPCSIIWSSSSLNILCRCTCTARSAWATGSALGLNTMWYSFMLKIPSPSKQSWKSPIGLSLITGMYTCFYSVDSRLQLTLIMWSSSHACSICHSEGYLLDIAYVASIELATAQSLIWWPPKALRSCAGPRRRAVGLLKICLKSASDMTLTSAPVSTLQTVVVACLWNGSVVS